MRSLKTILLLLFFSFNIFNANADYPKSKQEKELDKMDSVIGGEGLVFRPTKIKNESTKTTESGINKYLWEASLKTINYIPLASVDKLGGVIISEWHIAKDNPNYKFKVNIFIKDDVVSPEAIEVKVFEQILKNNKWVENDKPSNLALAIEKEILEKARELYIASTSNK